MEIGWSFASFLLGLTMDVFSRGVHVFLCDFSSLSQAFYLNLRLD
jgi:hypothetical protein